jgi:cell division protein FtsZ
MRVSVVSTGIDAAAMAQPRPTVISLAASRSNRAVAAAPRMEGSAALKMEVASAAPAPAAAAQPFAVLAAPAAEIKVAPAALESPQPAVAAVPALAVAPAPAPATKMEPSFNPPRPVEPTMTSRGERQAAADPFAAAAMANGGREPAKERRRTMSLFERVTGVGRARQASAAPAHAAAPSAAAVPAAPSPAAVSAPAAQPAQPRLGSLDPADRITPPRTEDDLLEIPAFLRRQAN